MRGAKPIVFSIAGFIAMSIAVAHAVVAGEPVGVRVVTFNAAGIDSVHPHRAERMAAIPAHLARLNADVIAMQEVFRPDDDGNILAALRAAGFVTTLSFNAGANRSGLLLAARWPLMHSRFVKFAASGRPWYSDWWAAKGVGIAHLESPAGPIAVAVTHVHAGYGDPRTQAAQVAQMAEILAALRAEFDAGMPVILAGDLNRRAGTLGFELLMNGGNFGIAGPDDDGRIDHVLFRTGENFSVSESAFGIELADPVELENGVLATLSDHEAMMADLALMPGEGGAAPACPRDAAAWKVSVAEARPLLADEAAMVRGEAWRMAVPTFVALVAGVVLWWLTRKRHAMATESETARESGKSSGLKIWLRRGARVTAIGLVGVAVIFGYAAVVVLPGFAANLDAAEKTLAAWPE